MNMPCIWQAHCSSSGIKVQGPPSFHRNISSQSYQGTRSRLNVYSSKRQDNSRVSSSRRREWRRLGYGGDSLWTNMDHTTCQPREISARQVWLVDPNFCVCNAGFPMADSVDVQLPPQLGQLSHIIDEKPESIASGSSEARGAALKATEYVFNLGLFSPHYSLPVMF